MEIIFKYLITSRLLYFHCHGSWMLGVRQDFKNSFIRPPHLLRQERNTFWGRILLLGSQQAPGRPDNMVEAHPTIAGRHLPRYESTNAMPMRPERENCSRRVNGLEHNRLPLNWSKPHLGEKQLFPRYTKEKATRQASSSYFFILVIFIYFSGAFSGTESNFFPGKVPANRENCKPRFDRRFVRTLQFEKQRLSRSAKENEESNFYPGQR